MTFSTSRNLLSIVVIVSAITLLSITDMGAQSVSRQVIGFAGGSASLNDTRINWTAGETFIGKASSSNQQAMLTIGFQQPNLVISSSSADLVFPLTLSPNPTPDLVNILIKDPTQQNLRLTLSNANGQVLVPSLLLNPWQNELNLSAYPAGVYLITIKDQNRGLQQAYKLIKY
ncbi:MAG TPA: T9SS type A sorting domain-containing protein [Saprospiraceae bacterium]|nr:T9SS type A sorting domain-containing protein [Saprospiraceae bacterium]